MQAILTQKKMIHKVFNLIRHGVESSSKQEELQEVESGDLGERGPPVYKQ